MSDDELNEHEEWCAFRESVIGVGETVRRRARPDAPTSTPTPTPRPGTNHLPETGQMKSSDTSTPTPDARTCVRCSLTRWYAGPWNDHSLQSCDEIIAARAEGEKAATNRIADELAAHARHQGSKWWEGLADNLKRYGTINPSIEQVYEEASDAG